MEDFFALVVVKEEVVALGVEFALDWGGGREALGKGDDGLRVGEEVLAAVENEGGDGDVVGLGGEAGDESLDGAQETQGEGGEVPGVGGGLLLVDFVPGDLDLIDLSDAFQGNSMARGEGGGEAQEGESERSDSGTQRGDG